MSCFGGRRSTADGQKALLARKQNDAIDRQLKADARKFKKEIKILLLGGGESGKSTVVKQMKVIHKGGFSVEERRTWKHYLFHNLVDAFSLLIDEIHQGGKEIDSSRSSVCAATVSDDLL